MTTRDRTIGVGLVGCGRFAQTAHLGNLARLPGARLVAIAEPQTARRAAGARRIPGARVVADFSDLLVLDDVEAVVLALPPALHAGAAVAAFQAGKHVYLEKPLAIDAKGGRAVRDAWRASGRVGMIGLNYRFDRLYREARDIVREGRLGKPVAASSIFTAASGEGGTWQRSRASGGGALLDLASHHVDLARWLLGQEVEEVHGAQRSAVSEGDTAALRLRLSGGTFVQSLFSHRAGYQDRFEILCERGRVRVDRGRALAAEVTTGAAGRRDRIRHLWRSARNIGYGWEKYRAPGGVPSWRTALERFVAAVAGEDTEVPDLEDGWRSLEVVLAAEESARTGHTVPLRDGAAEFDPTPARR